MHGALALTTLRPAGPTDAEALSKLATDSRWKVPRPGSEVENWNGGREAPVLANF